MEISQRLKIISELVTYETLGDIGTDHGYVPIYLYNIGKIKKALACDIRKGPLEKATANVKAYGGEAVIETRLGSGLEPIEAGEVETAVIAGMGGMLTIEILKKSPQVVASLKELILSPQHDIGAVRKYLHTINFSIAKETMMKEDGKYYTILVCRNEKEPVYEKEIEYLYGKKLLEEKNSVLKEVLIREEKKYNEIGESLEMHPTDNAREALKEVNEKLLLLKEAMAWM